jgi:ABC-type phosphate/phosphonate transport system permease subunit
MKPLSQNTYSFTSHLPPDELGRRLHDRTLKSNFLGMQKTDRDFIGKPGRHNFSVISAFFPIGFACVITGELKGLDTSDLTLTTSLHPIFTMLLIACTGTLLGAAILFTMLADSGRSIMLLSALSVLSVAAIFRLITHGVYIYARNEAIRKITRILELTPRQN